ncbi:hypothetical protein EJE24_12920 [Enterobacter huaxiensis]|jgi:hypothetical protein|uniref:Trimeric autotransporter adhesin YadA-like C-terminal membrane anchor domain-containing protein n=1 Tax=Enterobacter huaxiensis TaxID=2494702 RepID=A0A428LRH7_9ENTR|nr:YadA C-terminal domain-containing protein [Enterobacter huaxiensis]RSK67455.1 hypothetical protein EJE24_12920 [Enterobacter huaxiensis]
MKKSIIAVLLSAVITPAAFADSFSLTLDQNGNVAQGVQNPAQGIFDVNPTAGKVTLFGTENTVANLDQIQNNLSLIQDHQSQITANNIAIGNETTRAEVAEQGLARSKVDITDYNIDQQQQADLNTKTDKELDDHAYQLRLLDSRSQGLQAAIVSHGDRMNAIQSDVDNDTAKINKETTDRSAADQRQQQQITNNTNATRTNAGAITANQKTIANNKTSIDRLSGQNGTTYKLAAATARLSIHEEQQIVTLAQDTKVAQATGEYAQSRAQIAMQNAEKNRAALVASNKKIAANSVALADHEQRIETLEQSNSSNFGKLKSEVDENRKRASAGIAGVAAMANIPQVTNTQNFSVGAGVGNTDGENALAVGFSARATENVVVKASVSDDSQHNFVVGGGIAYGW